MGTCIYFISDNRSAFQLLRKDATLRQFYPEDYVSTVTLGDLGTFRGSADELAVLASEEDVLEALETRKQWLDLSYFALVAVYGLQIIDANVDGHLFDYDISPDISLNISPNFSPVSAPSAGLTFTLTF